MTAVPESSAVPVCPEYHPLSDLRTRPGYYPNLTTDHIEAMNQLDTLILKDKLDIVTDDENLFLKKLRFLRARQFNAKKAFDMLKNDCTVRQSSSRVNLRHERAEDVLQCDLSLVYQYFPSWVQGFDNQDRPIAWRHFGGKFEIWNILKLTTMERLVRFHAWEGEQAIRIMREQSARVGWNIETFVVIIDAAGWHTGLATSDAFSYIKGMASTDSDHYPERLGRLMVINAPSTINMAWKLISRFLDSVTRTKIQIYGTNPEEWQPQIFEFVARDQVPVMFGGTAPDPTPEDAINSINPPSAELHAQTAEEIAEEGEELKAEAAHISGDTANMEQLATEFQTMLTDGVKPPNPPDSGQAQAASTSTPDASL